MFAFIESIFTTILQSTIMILFTIGMIIVNIFASPMFNKDADLIHSATHGDIAKVEKLIEKKADVNAIDRWQNTPLMLAAENAHIEIVVLLIDAGAQVNIQNNRFGINALMVASRNGHIEIVNLLIEKGADINIIDREYTALIYASENGHIEIVKLLIENNADISAIAQGHTALMAASDAGHIEIVELLRAAGTTE